MTPESLVRTVSDFLAGARGAVVLENGAAIFDLSEAKYSISGEHNKCLLHLWSAERNTVRRVVDAEVKNGVLRLAVQRLGQARPTKIEICRERDRRTPSAKKAVRAAYVLALGRPPADEELADWDERQGLDQLRDRFLVLAADAALSGGNAVEAERLRGRLLELYVNGVAVCDTIALPADLTPARLLLWSKDAPVEFESVTVPAL